MFPCVRFSCRAVVLLLAFTTLRAHEEWNNLHIVWSAPTVFTYPFDGRSPKVAIALLNHHDFTSAEVAFALNVNGARQTGAGFTAFPNGGSIRVSPNDYGWASAWTSGVYDGRLGAPPAAGEAKDVTFDFVFSLSGAPASDPDADVDDEPYTQTQVVRFINAGEDPPLLGTFGVSGTLRFPTLATSPAPANVLVEVATPVSTKWFPLATTGVPSGAGPVFSFSSPLPPRNDWHIRFSADGYETRVMPLGLFNDPRKPIDVTLTPAATPSLDYRRIAAITTPTGFWRGAVAESEGTLVVFPGQENWKTTTTDADARALRAASRIYKYKFDGTKLWEHAPGWETWAGDMTPDGRFVAYALNPTATNFYTPTENKLVLLDGATGAVLWTKSAAPIDAAIGKKIDALEVAFSPDAKWLAVGSAASGQVTLVDRASGNFVWSTPGVAPAFGQVRRLRFSGDAQALYCGSGDGFLRKLRVSDGAVLWKAFVGSWPSVRGLDVSADGAWITTGTQSLDTAIVRARDGYLQQSIETQARDAAFSADGRFVVTAGGHVFRVSDGVIAGMTKTDGLTRFTPDGNFLVRLDRTFALHDLAGKQLKSFGDTGIGATSAEAPQWSHLTRDGHYAIVLARDMLSPPATGIAIFERQTATIAPPTIVAQPLAQTAPLGGATTLNVAATGGPPLSFQWRKNGADLVAQNSAALTFASATASDAGSYTCVVTNAAGTVTSAAATLTVAATDAANPPRLANLAVRTVAGPGAKTLIVGFVIGGGGTTGNKPLLLRGAGPALTQLGVLTPMPDPRLALFRAGALLASNNDWGGDSAVAALATQVGAFPFPSNNSADAALTARPDPGAYTMQVTSADDRSGTTLAEIYDGSASFGATVPRLINLSARADAGGANGPLIAGFVVTGSTARTVLVRGIGPALAPFGVTNALADPQLTLFRDATQVAANDNWYDAANAVAIATAMPQVGAFPLVSASRDAALLLSLPPGNYTAQVTGAAGTSGNVLVEVYEVP